MKRTLLLLLWFAGCRAPAQQPVVGCNQTTVDPLAAVLVADARLEDMTLWQAGLGVGHAQGDSTLVVTTTDGVEQSFDARLDGTHFGLVVDASDDNTLGAAYPLALPPGLQISVRQLLGHYQGPHVGIDVVVGGHWRQLKNPSNVSLNVTSLSFGLGAVPATWEDLDLELWDDPLTVVDDPCLLGGCLAGEGEGEPVCAEHLGHCTVDAVNDRSDCCGLDDVCVPALGGAAVGVCALPCGTVDDAQQVVKSAIACDGSTTCQAVTRLGDAAVVAVACLTPAAAQNDVCNAVLDETYGDDACPGDLDCAPAQAYTDVNGAEVYTAFRCKQPCDPANPASVDVCAAVGEECVFWPAPLPDGTHEHVCGTIVPAATAAAVATWPADGTPDPAYTCNEVEASRTCDQSMFAGADPATAGVDLCLAVTGGSAPDDGICFALCRMPAVDTDGDGVLEVERQDFACGAGYACDTRAARALGLAFDLFDPAGGPRACSCGDGAPCPADCGVSDAVCDARALCTAPLASCERAP